MLSRMPGVISVGQLAAGEDDLDPFGGEVCTDLAAVLDVAASAEVLNEDHVKVAAVLFYAR